MQQRTFNLRLWFALGSFGAIAAICVVAAIALSAFITDSLLGRESEVSQELLEAIVAVNGAEMFRDTGAATPYQSPELLDFGKHAVKIPGMLRVNIYATTRRVLWSTEPKLIGQSFTDNVELDEALTGKIVASISYLNADNKDEHIELGNVDHFIESYMPLHADAGRGPVAGVMEFYRLPLRLDDTLTLAQILVWGGAAAAALLLYAALYWIVDRGARLIERQQREISRIETFAAVGQMSSAVAHSLRNPMAAIRSSAELWRSMLPQDGAGIADEIITDVDRMDSYVRDLLSYAQPEASELRAVDADAVIRQVIDKLAPTAERQGVRIAVEGRKRPVRVRADDKLLGQAITTFITNALEATPKGGRLRVTLDRGRSRRYWQISVADTGRGIAPDVLDRVSSAYFTTKPGGLGLGLVLARGIVERFGGRMAIASTEGEGTEVRIELRAA